MGDCFTHTKFVVPADTPNGADVTELYHYLLAGQLYLSNPYEVTPESRDDLVDELFRTTNRTSVPIGTRDFSLTHYARFLRRVADYVVEDFKTVSEVSSLGCAIEVNPRDGRGITIADDAGYADLDALEALLVPYARRYQVSPITIAWFGRSSGGRGFQASGVRMIFNDGNVLSTDMQQVIEGMSRTGKAPYAD